MARPVVRRPDTGSKDRWCGTAHQEVTKAIILRGNRATVIPLIQLDTSKIEASEKSSAIRKVEQGVRALDKMLQKLPLTDAKDSSDFFVRTRPMFTAGASQGWSLEIVPQMKRAAANSIPLGASLATFTHEAAHFTLLLPDEYLPFRHGVYYKNKKTLMSDNSYPLSPHHLFAIAPLLNELTGRELAPKGPLSAVGGWTRACEEHIK